MTLLCPYCKQPMSGEMSIPPMRPRMMRIYKATLEAGTHGITPEDLLVRMYDDGEWPTPGGPVVLRVQICEMNKILGTVDQRIVSAHRGRYRLMSLKEAGEKLSDVEEAEAEADY